LKDGEIIERGTHDELIQRENGWYADSWNASSISTAKRFLKNP
jgi:ABC-type multidrug transport system fused ATPase/permease subunit